MSDGEKQGRGGFREGSGRKKIGGGRKQIQISLSAEKYELYKGAAEKAGMSFSAFISDCVERRIAPLTSQGFFPQGTDLRSFLSRK